MNFDAGRLTCKITIQTATYTPDSHNTPIPTWTTYATVWARIKPTAGNERYINQQIIAEVTHEITIRYKSGITPKMRVLYGSRIFNIIAVHDIDERHVEIRLICKELV